ncbi:DUF3748 domain-containing protein [Algoriphagus lutimaris]|uniref:DUF3748 domain-containing protein n=1 Tax=Algoriphagus lutimaris TaxID=613197 RepID=UPI00196B315E|nr:DUF3748 domain-containing protein [Algoriphagus lutimaris]MBN3518787.1 DUF3748 domain-containing protein [Algoriphagus lutimaris]
MDLNHVFTNPMVLHEIQMTEGPQGHFLNQRQAFSPYDQFLAFDNRNEDSKIGENASIQFINLFTKKVSTVYKLENQQNYGPGVGAVSFHPKENKIVFIHGLRNASEKRPYYITRRFAMQLDLDDDLNTFPLDARDVQEPFTLGALRGGSHAYSYSSDGQMVSFTYNDEVLEQEAQVNPEVVDLRTVGAILTNEPVSINGNVNHENFNGSGFAILLAEVTANPEKGSDQISKAYEECWVGKSGYKRQDGTVQARALAYLGNVVLENGEKATEIFISDIPDDLELLKIGVTSGARTILPTVPEGVKQRRLTHTSTHTYPGIQGPRQWLRSSPDGSKIYFYKKDEKGIVQIYSVSPADGTINQVSYNDFSADTSFDLSFDGKYFAYGSKESLYLTKEEDGETIQVLAAPKDLSHGLSNINWANTTYQLAYNRKVNSPEGPYFQIFTLSFSN